MQIEQSDNARKPAFVPDLSCFRRRAAFLPRSGTKSRFRRCDIDQRRERTMNRESSEGGMRQKSGDAEKEGMGSHNFGGAKDSRHDKAIDHTQSAVASAKDALSSGVKAGDSEIGALQDQIAQLAGTVTQLVKDQTSRARGQVMEAVGTAGDSVSQTAAVAKDSLASLEADVEARIKRNPWSAVAIAALVGLLIGKMTW
jgi:ElaB/YqjD/DUF883 family membrane-anchored ribosome-binding protein